MIIEKKCWSDSFQKILDGKKTCEVRLGDSEFNEGDILVLKEYNPKEGYTGREIRKTITLVQKTKEMPYWTEEEKTLHGFIVLSLK